MIVGASPHLKKLFLSVVCLVDEVDRLSVSSALDRLNDTVLVHLDAVEGEGERARLRSP